MGGVDGDGERQLELVHAWLCGYAAAMEEVGQVLAGPARRRRWWRAVRRLRGYGGGTA